MLPFLPIDRRVARRESSIRKIKFNYKRDEDKNSVPMIYRRVLFTKANKLNHEE